MNFTDESVDYASVSETYRSVDSKRFNNKLDIEEFPSIKDQKSGDVDDEEPSAPYASVDLKKKREDRLKKQTTEIIEEDIYEDIGNGAVKPTNQTNESDIYEVVSYAEVGDKFESDTTYAEPNIH
jgi:hypothetical protein